jgi:HEAT repeat protein
MSKQAFDKKIEALDALRSAPDRAATASQLRKALTDRNNFLASKAAAIVADLSLSDLIPDLIAAFERFLRDPAKSDPQCWAKNAIAKALKNLGHRDPAFYLLGIDFFQPEPVWGGSSDSAATLRGACALALIDCPLDDLTILTHLTDRLADPAKPVRIDTATAIAQLGRPEGALLLRLKALAGDKEPEVIGQCFLSLLSLDARESIGFIGRFLKVPDEDVRSEAANALAQARQPEAIELLKSFWEGALSPEMRRALLLSLGASPLPESTDFLLAVLANGSPQVAEYALAALAPSRLRSGMRERIRAVVEERNDSALRQLFEREFQRANEV